MPNYDYITYDGFKEKILNGDYVFDRFIFSEYFYKNITTDEPDIIYFGQQIYDIIHIHDRKKLNDKLNFVFTNCKFGSMVHFDFEALPNVSILRFRNCDFDNNTIFKNLQIDTSEREKGKKFKFNYCFFENVKFQTVDFENVEFKTSNIFDKTEFLDVTTFDNCIFKKDLFARNLRFTNDVIVIGSVLEKRCELRCTFEKDLYIVSSSRNAINETTNEIEDEIKHTKFLGSTLFASEFKGGIIFNGADFNDTFIFRPNSLSQNNIYFENINFHSVAKFNNLILGENIYFNNVDLSFISLVNSNFYNASFINCKITTKKIFDENLISRYSSHMDLTNVVNELRMFEMSFDKRKNFEQAGEFHIRALDLERRFTKWSSSSFPKIADILNKLRVPRIKQITLFLYKWTSDYGENYAKSLRKIIYVIILFSFIYLYTGLSYSNYNIWWWDSSKPHLFTDWGSSLLYSLSSSSPIRRDSEIIKSLGGWTSGFSILQAIIQTILGTLFIIGIRRKFKR